MALFHPLFVCVLVCSFCFVALGGSVSVQRNFVVVPTSSFEPAAVCSTSRVTTSEPNRASVPLAHRHGPCAPSGPRTSEKPSLAETLRRNRARTDYILGKQASGQRMTTLSADGGASVPTYLGDAVDSLEYVVTLGIGTPAVQQTVLIDTGSDLTWVQCQPCNSTQCYPQKDPLFDPTKSSTFAPIPCATDSCKQLAVDGYNNSCTTGTASLCGYAIEYGNGAITTGVYATETLTLNAGVSVSNFSFGCGSNQHGPYDKFDGLLGLGGAPESLVSQTASLYGGAFSYCLPPTNGSAGFLTLGAPSGSNSTAGFVFTPMYRLEPEFATFYVVTLTGISVGGKPLDIAPSVFSGGLIIDSGTVITGIPETAYVALRTAFRSAMSQYPLLPPSEETGLDTCYNFTGHTNIVVPKVALTFNGSATVDLDVPSGVLLEGCLAFAGEGRDGVTGIIGNVNQRTIEVLYDSRQGSVGFRAGAC